jgi:hypothetical protein
MQTPSISKEFWIFSGLIVVLFLVGLYVQLFVFRNQETVLVQDGKTGEVQENAIQPVEIKDVPAAGLLRVDWVGRAQPISTSSEYYQWIADAKTRLYEIQPEVKRMSDERSAGEVSPTPVTLFTLGTVTTPSTLAGKPLLLMNVPIYAPVVKVLALVPNEETKSFTVVDIQRIDDLDTILLADVGTLSVRGMEPCIIDQGSDGKYLVEYDDVMCTDLFTHEMKVVVELDQVPQEIPHQNGAGTLRYLSTLGKEGFGLPYNIGGYVTSPTPEDESLMFEQIDPEFVYNGKTVYSYRGGYVVRRSDGAWLLYRFDPYFFSPEEGDHKEMYPLAASINEQVEWLDGSVRTNEYWPGLIYSFSGCGSIVDVTRDVVDMNSSDAEWFKEAELTPIAKTKRGDMLYGFAQPEKNSRIQLLVAATFGQFVNENDPTSFQKILDQLTESQRQTADLMIKQPVLFFWKDPEQRWRGYIDASIQSPAECGKPVIYLYPPQTTDVNVRVMPNGGFTVTIPEYPVGGWNVKAEPNGALTSYDDGQSYPYLFWEGHASGFDYPQQGFVFAQSEVEAGMKNVLTKFGMNEQETADFLEFWLPKMVEKPYVFVTFADQRDFERAAPLKITPKPDSVLRVFMYFEGLDASRAVEPLSIRPFVRKGFSVIEWGGVLVR